MFTERKFNQPNSNNGCSPSRLTSPHTSYFTKSQIPNSRKSTTPSRIKDRITSSPLRVPLEHAIEQCSRNNSIQQPNSSRVLDRSKSRDGDSSIMRRGKGTDENMNRQRKAHSQTLQFIKTYFDFDNLIPLPQFMEKIVQRYQKLWENQDIELALQQFEYKILEIFGDPIQPGDLISFTKQNGMIGLILHVFRVCNECETQSTSQYKRSSVGLSRSPQIVSINRSFEQQLGECVKTQDLKNIIQEFMESMYKVMESEIYAKFNVEMRRMVLKYREAEKMVKKVEENLIMHADYYEVQKRWKAKNRIQEEERQQLRKKLEKVEDDLKKEREINQQLRHNKANLKEENAKLRQNIQKYQSIMLNKFQSFPLESINASSNLSLIRKQPNIPLNDCTQNYNNQNYCCMNEPQPYQIKIDTQFFNDREVVTPFQNTTPFMEQNYNPCQQSFCQIDKSQFGYSPIKIDSCRPSLEGELKPEAKKGEYNYVPFRRGLSRPL